MKSIISATQLCKTVRLGADDLTILDRLELHVTSGETLAILGASGSGKTTLLSLLAGLDTPSGGQVFIEDANFFSLSEDDRAKLRGRLMGFVFQSFQLIGSLTALENVMLPLELQGAAGARHAALAALEAVGLTHRLGHYPTQLSGGEQQRVAIARAFAPRPKILLADEPTGNLDQDTGAAIIDLLFRLNTEHATTLLLVTHDTALAKRCTQQYRLSGGRLWPVEAANAVVHAHR